MSGPRASHAHAHDSDEEEDGPPSDVNFTMNAKGYIRFNKNLIIAERYQLVKEIVLDEELGTTAKGRYGSVFVVQDLEFEDEMVLKALKINRIPPESEDIKRQAVKRRLKAQQKKRLNKKLAKYNNTNNKNAANTNAAAHPRRAEKTVHQRYKSSCRREIGVLKRISRKNKDEKYPVLVLYDFGEYLGHTYMIFPIFDQTLQQHLVYCQRERDTMQTAVKNGTKNQNKNNSIEHHERQNNSNNNNNNNTNTSLNCLLSPLDLWSILEQLLSAISYVHIVCSVMHLDFKPKNIMINKYGYDVVQSDYNRNLFFVKLRAAKITLIDFSVSAKAPKNTDLDEVRFTGNFGTRRYRPPEMIYGGKWNRSVDTYGTAMIVLECVRMFPIIDTTYYKKKKIVKYKTKYRHSAATAAATAAAQASTEHDPNASTNRRSKSQAEMRSKIQSKKQLEIWEVLYLILQQIGFPSDEHWKTNLDLDTKLLFPSKHQWLHMNDKRKCELFANYNYSLSRTQKQQRKHNRTQKKRAKKQRRKERRRRRRLKQKRLKLKQQRLRSKALAASTDNVSEEEEEEDEDEEHDDDDEDWISSSSSTTESSNTDDDSNSNSNSSDSSTDSSASDSESDSESESESDSSTDSNSNNNNHNRKQKKKKKRRRRRRRRRSKKKKTTHISDMALFCTLFNSDVCRGQIWKLFQLYGLKGIAKYNLHEMCQCLQRMVEWDPRKRIKPEQALQEYFQKIPTYLLIDDNDDDEDDEEEPHSTRFQKMNHEFRAKMKEEQQRPNANTTNIQNTKSNANSHNGY